nr:hypothetical protein [Petrachloros mirabilis]
MTSGKAFEATLKQTVNEWRQHRSNQSLIDLQGLSLLLPFLGLCGGICVFLASGLSVYGLPPKFSYGLSLPMTIFTGVLLWRQLGQLLQQLAQGGSQALDLDSIR